MRQLECAREVRFIPAAEGRPMDAVLSDAWDDGLDMIVRPVLTTRECAHLKSTDAKVFAMILWIAILQALTWGLADEQFGSETALHVQFWPTGRAADAAALEQQVIGQVVHDLDDLQQGFNLFNVFITPSGLGAGHWEDIGHNLLPLSRQALQREFIRLASKPDDPQSFAAGLQAVGDRTRKTMALLVGAPSSGGSPRFADRDAERLADALVNGMSPAPCVQRTVRVLTNLDATRARVVDGFQSWLAPHALAGDRVVLFLSARGEIDSAGTAWLMLTGANPRSPATAALSVDELAGLLNDLPAGVAVTLIASVAWNMAPRGTDEPPAAPGPDPLIQLAQSVPGLVVLSNSNTGEIVEIESASCSLLTDELVRLLAEPSPGDPDPDGILTVADIASALREPVESWSTLAGTPCRLVTAGAADAPLFEYSITNEPRHRPADEQPDTGTADERDSQ